MKRFALLLIAGSLAWSQPSPEEKAKRDAEWKALLDKKVKLTEEIRDYDKTVARNCMIILRQTSAKKTAELTVAEWRDMHTCLDTWKAARRDELGNTDLAQ